MPFKSEKQRKWMHANEPEMAKKWEKEESIRGKLRNVIRQEIKSVNEVRWPDTQTADLLSQAFKDARVRVSKVWEKGNHKYILRVRATDGNVNVKMELNVISNVIMMDTQSGHVRLGELQPGSRGRKLSKNLKMLSKLPAFGVAGFKGLKYKIESISQLQEIVREEIYTLMEATEKAKWTSDELALIKKLKVKVDGKQHKFKIEKSGRDKNRKAKFDTKDTWGTIEKWLIRGKTSYSGWFSAWEGGGLGWKGSEIKSSRDFDEEQNLKLLVSMFKKLQTKINRVWN